MCKCMYFTWPHVTDEKCSGDDTRWISYFRLRGNSHTQYNVSNMCSDYTARALCFFFFRLFFFFEVL